jgi:hypothetical protein
MANSHSGAQDSVLGRTLEPATPLLTDGMVSIAMVHFLRLSATGC